MRRRDGPRSGRDDEERIAVRSAPSRLAIRSGSAGRSAARHARRTIVAPGDEPAGHRRAPSSTDARRRRSAGEVVGRVEEHEVERRLGRQPAQERRRPATLGPRARSAKPVVSRLARIAASGVTVVVDEHARAPRRATAPRCRARHCPRRGRARLRPSTRSGPSDANSASFARSVVGRASSLRRRTDRTPGTRADRRGSLSPADHPQAPRGQILRVRRFTVRLALERGIDGVAEEVLRPLLAQLRRASLVEVGVGVEDLLGDARRGCRVHDRLVVRADGRA